MPDALPTGDSDFSAQMQALVIEAAQAREDKTQKPQDKRSGTETAGSAQLPISQMLRPLLVGMESLIRTQTAQAATLERLEKALGAHATVPEVLYDARQALDQRNLVNRAMFDALHKELKEYKDTFLLEAVVRPIVRDLISLYDDAREIHRQVWAMLSTKDRGPAPQPFFGILQNLATNLEHHSHYMLEVLERLEVRMALPITGKLDKRNQRVVLREPADTEDEDLLVVRSMRPGFTWRDRLFRPEEVAIKKWGLSPDSPHDGDVPDSPPA